MLRTYRVVRHVDEIRITFGRMPDVYFRIADYVELLAGELNGILLCHTTRHDAVDWERFQHRRLESTDWLTNEKASSSKTKVVIVHPAQISVDAGALLDEPPASGIVCDRCRAARERVVASGAPAEETMEVGWWLHRLGNRSVNTT